MQTRHQSRQKPLNPRPTQYKQLQTQSKQSKRAPQTQKVDNKTPKHKISTHRSKQHAKASKTKRPATTQTQTQTKAKSIRDSKTKNPHNS